MNIGSLDGTGKLVCASIIEAVGNVAGGSKSETDGAVKKALGNAKNVVGAAKDEARGMVNE